MYLVVSKSVLFKPGFLGGLVRPQNAAYFGLALVCLIMSGCVAPGQPLVTEQSAQVTPAKPSAPRPARGAKVTTVTPAKRAAPVVAERSYRAAAPVRMPKQVKVQKGDTLYSIAWRYGLDFKHIARWNDIPSPYQISIGQFLKLTGEGHSTPKKTISTSKTISKSQPVVRKSTPKTNTPKLVTKPPSRVANHWLKPLDVPPMRRFGKNSKGLDYSLTKPAKLRAASAGKVVYAGNGIGGYSHLVIIKHTPALLSAYSFNGPIQVSEQQAVKAGTVIADIKNMTRGQQNVRFELRNNGEPVDPQKYLKQG